MNQESNCFKDIIVPKLCKCLSLAYLFLWSLKIFSSVPQNTKCFPHFSQEGDTQTPLWGHRGEKLLPYLEHVLCSNTGLTEPQLKSANVTQEFL